MIYAMDYCIAIAKINILIIVVTHLCDQLFGADANPEVTTQNRNTQAKKEMVIFDTDKTIWPFNVNDHDYEVFKNAQKTKNSSYMPFPEVKEALKFVKEKGFKIGLLSTCDDPKKIKKILQTFGLIKLFDFLEIGLGSKEFHIRVLRALAKVEYHDILYFQFPAEEITAIMKLNVLPLPVDRNGLTIECVQKGLDVFASRPKSGRAKRKS